MYNGGSSQNTTGLPQYSFTGTVMFSCCSLKAGAMLKIEKVICRTCSLVELGVVEWVIPSGFTKMSLFAYL